MYENYFQLNRRPFAAAPNPDHYFPASSIEKARESLIHTVERVSGPALVIGPVGTGKTLLCQLMANHFRRELPACVLTSTRLCTRHAFLQAMLYELGLPFRNMDEGELRIALIDHLSMESICPNGVLLIIDEADSLPLMLLEELRVITNLVQDGQPRVRLLLVGGPRLEERLAHPRMESLNQRISCRLYLAPFSPDETAGYIEARMLASGTGTAKLFTPSATKRIHMATDGIPRVINQLCEQVLELAATAECERIDQRAVDEAWADLQQLPVPATHSSHSASATTIEFGPLDEHASPPVQGLKPRPVDSPAVATGVAAGESGDTASQTPQHRLQATAKCRAARTEDDVELEPGAFPRVDASPQPDQKVSLFDFELVAAKVTRQVDVPEGGGGLEITPHPFWLRPKLQSEAEPTIPFDSDDADSVADNDSGNTNDDVPIVPGSDWPIHQVIWQQTELDAAGVILGHDSLVLAGSTGDAEASRYPLPRDPIAETAASSAELSADHDDSVPPARLRIVAAERTTIERADGVKLHFDPPHEDPFGHDFVDEVIVVQQYASPNALAHRDLLQVSSSASEQLARILDDARLKLRLVDCEVDEEPGDPYHVTPPASQAPSTFQRTEADDPFTAADKSAGGDELQLEDDSAESEESDDPERFDRPREIGEESWSAARRARGTDGRTLPHQEFDPSADPILPEEQDQFLMPHFGGPQATSLIDVPPSAWADGVSGSWPPDQQLTAGEIEIADTLPASDDDPGSAIKMEAADAGPGPGPKSFSRLFSKMRRSS